MLRVCRLLNETRVCRLLNETQSHGCCCCGGGCVAPTVASRFARWTTVRQRIGGRNSGIATSSSRVTIHWQMRAAVGCATRSRAVRHAGLPNAAAEAVDYLARPLELCRLPVRFTNGCPLCDFATLSNFRQCDNRVYRVISFVASVL